MISIIVLWAFMGYGLTTILVYGSIFEVPRERIKKNSKFFGDLIKCVMCTSTWVGFFMSIVLGGLSTRILETHWVLSIFFDGMATCGMVWAINGIVEFFEESRIK